MAAGTAKLFNADRGFAFIRRDDGLPLSVIEFGRLTSLAIVETVGTRRLEAQYPVADDLKANPPILAASDRVAPS